jgi:type VI secretion system protein ImpF
MASRSIRLQPPTVFDRLLDFEPDLAEDRPIAAREHARRHRDSIRRDLEILLNTQQPPRRLAEGTDELSTSLLQYGSPGFHGLMLATKQQHLALAKSLQTLIETFETRLRNVRVALGEDKSARVMRALHLKIHAAIRFDDLEEPVVFDTLLDPATRQFRISGSRANG